MAGVLAELARQRDDLRIVSLNVDENSGFVELYPISALPTLGVFKQGQLEHTIVGAQPKSELAQKIESALAA